MRKLLSALVGAGALIFTSGITQAANVTPDVIFGSGNANGDFTVTQNNGIEIGLRAKQRYPTPANVFNYNGTDTYTFEAGEGTPGRPLWNFEWSVNTNFDGNSGYNLSDLTYKLRLDSDPGVGATFVEFDPIITAYADHALGNNSTTNGDGFVAPNAGEYSVALTNFNVAQNSWAMHWFVGGFDPFAAGTYAIQLEAFLGDVSLAMSGINVVVTAVPLPAALPLYGAGVALLGYVGWRRKRKMA